MVTVLALLGVVAVLFVAAVVSTRDGPVLADAPPDAADLGLPDGPLAPADVAGVRFGLAPRGYRMSEVDEVLDRLAAELADRDARLALLEAGVTGSEAALPVHEAGAADLPTAAGPAGPDQGPGVAAPVLTKTMDAGATRAAASVDAGSPATGAPVHDAPAGGMQTPVAASTMPVDAPAAVQAAAPASTSPTSDTPAEGQVSTSSTSVPPGDVPSSASPPTPLPGTTTGGADAAGDPVADSPVAAESPADQASGQPIAADVEGTAPAATAPAASTARPPGLEPSASSVRIDDVGRARASDPSVPAEPSAADPLEPPQPAEVRPGDLREPPQPAD